MEKEAEILAYGLSRLVWRDEALALKTSYELGLLTKPTRIDYQVVAKLAAVGISLMP